MGSGGGAGGGSAGGKSGGGKGGAGGRSAARRKANPLHQRGVTEVHWTDTSFLRTFLSDRGKIRSRRVTGLTGQQQRRVATAIKNAREMALLPYATTSR